MNLKAALQEKLTEKELSLLKTSFDIIGNIAVLEIPPNLKRKEKLIAETLLKLHKNLKTVCKKSSERKGIYRLRGIKKISGNGFETIHRESGCRFKLDIRKAYFSVRESTERQRIADLVKEKEKVLVLFSGIGPSGVIIAKKCPCQIKMVEINPTACKYAEENIRLNKVQENVNNYCADIKKISPKLGKFDRIIMPLPESAYRYMDLVLKNNSKKGTAIHLYGISEEKKLFLDLEEKIKKLRGKIKILNRKKVLPYGPRIWKVCLDMKVL